MTFSALFDIFLNSHLGTSILKYSISKLTPFGPIAYIVFYSFLSYSSSTNPFTKIKSLKKSKSTNS